MNQQPPTVDQRTWRMRLRIRRGYSPTFLAFGPEETDVSKSLDEILRYIETQYVEAKGKVTLSFTSNGHHEFYTLTPYRDEPMEKFLNDCRERITWFCKYHQIPLKTGE